MLKTVKSMITLKNYNYSEVHARLLIQDLYRKIYKSNKPTKFYGMLKNNVDMDKYDKELLVKYSKEDIEYLESKIDYSRDFTFKSVGIEQLIKKYLIKNKITGIIYETPQVMFMALSMAGFKELDKEKRLDFVINLYEALSTFKISLPTPIMANLRTPKYNYSSCVTISTDDTIPSWFTSLNAMGLLATGDSGIGWDISAIRNIGSDVGNGRMKHYGITPILKAGESVAGASKQGSRNSAVNTFIPWWNKEIEEILSLKSVRIEESKRIPKLDYTIIFNTYLYEAYKNNEVIGLFSTKETPDLLEVFQSSDKTKFKSVYTQYLNDKAIPKKLIKARDLVNSFLLERFETSRYYVMNIDEVNSNSAFNIGIKQSNLCNEIAIPTTPLQHIDDTLDNSKADIGVCILANINVGNAKIEEFPKLTNLLVNLLDNLIDNQNYMIKAAEVSTKYRRSLGIGANNLAYLFAKEGVKYGSKEALRLTHTTFENLQFNLLKASNNLAKEKGTCKLYNQTTYSETTLPIDRYNKNVDKLTDNTLTCDWETLRQDIKTYGLRNSTMSAHPPSETSSQISNSVSGLDPLRNLIIRKANGSEESIQIAPGYPEIAHNYDFVFDREINKDYLKTMAVVQKFTDQSISTNTFYNVEHYPNKKLPIKTMLDDLFLAKYYGIKTLYYQTTYTGTEIDTDTCENCSV